MTNQDQGIIRVTGIPYMATYRWSVGFPMERFIKALAKKKLLASKCPVCGRIYTPPRTRCFQCYSQMEEKDQVELSGQGTVTSYTVARVELDGAGNFKDLDTPKVIAAIKLEGADSTVFLPLAGVDPDRVETGMKVVPRWSKEPKGELTDLEGFQPA